MPKSKIAISIESSLLLETDTVAKELRISRSQIISDALIEYLHKYRNRKLLAKINAVCASDSDTEDVETMELIRSQMKKQENYEEWE